MQNEDNRNKSAGEEHSYLLARSSLSEYLSFMGDYATDGTGDDRRQLVNEWKAAATQMEDLRISEPDRADGQRPGPLSTVMKTHVAAVEADPIFQRAYSDSEYRIRHHRSRSRSRLTETGLPGTPSPAAKSARAKTFAGCTGEFLPASEPSAC